MVRLFVNDISPSSEWTTLYEDERLATVDGTQYFCMDGARSGAQDAGFMKISVNSKGNIAVRVSGVNTFTDMTITMTYIAASAAQ